MCMYMLASCKVGMHIYTGTCMYSHVNIYLCMYMYTLLNVCIYLISKYNACSVCGGGESHSLVSPT